jgi:iron complex transport system permease protein
MEAPPAPAPPATSSSNRRLLTVAGTLVVGVFALFVGSALIGPEWLPPNAIFAILLHQGTLGWLGSSNCAGLAPNATYCTIWTEIVWEARVPTMLIALCAGAALGISGGTLQGIFRNPLCDPFLLGISSGAAMGTAILFTFQIDVPQQAYLLPLYAFLGALIPGIVVYLAAGGSWRGPETLVLTGVAMAAFFSAILATLLFYNPTGGLQVSFWLLGNLNGASWTRVGILLGAILILGTLICFYGREINVLQLGAEVAESVGVEARRTTRRLIILTTLLTGAAVAFTGVIGFLGLVSPHVIRRLVGPDYRKVLPLAGVFGAIFLLLAWDVAQSVIPPVTVPVGIPTSFFGAPAFIYLLYRRRGFSS